MMDKINLSTLPREEVVIVNGENTVNTVGGIIEEIDFYRDKQVYTTKPYKASFDAEHIIECAIENEHNNMYDDWDEVIRKNITREDIEQIQLIFDRILARNPLNNIVFYQDKLIEVDI